MTKTCLFFIHFLLLFFAGTVSAQNFFINEKEIILGGDAGWPTFSGQENIAPTVGRFGKEALRIADNTTPLTQTSDLLLNFENGDVIIEQTGNYELVSSAVIAVTDTIMGDYAALGKGESGGIHLKGKEGSLFGSEGLTGSFTISFWLNPSLAENGETVFLWNSSRNVNNMPMYQMISLDFYNNRLEWNFTHVFSDFGVFKNIILKSSSLIIPDTWAFHSLTFDENTGLIEYRINGKIEALAYATRTGNAFGTIYSPILGTPADIEICPHFTGRIDDFSIRREVVHIDFNQKMYASAGGYFETQPMGPFPIGSTITQIESVSDIPSETTIEFFARGGDNFYEWTNDYPEWIPIQGNEPLSEISGKFFQIATFLHSDGAGSKTPILTELHIKYREQEPPLAPIRVFAEAGNGYVDLSWIPATNNDTGGYIVYYGNAPGEYLGKDAAQGSSPIDVGQSSSIRINGLTNGKIYYFAVAAYSYVPTKVEGSLSPEVYARPLRSIQ
ncbi:MAG: hypothetical protein R3Y36_05605 [Spirochaetales bacterium]